MARVLGGPISGGDLPGGCLCTMLIWGGWEYIGLYMGETTHMEIPEIWDDPAVAVVALHYFGDCLL